MPKKKAPEFDIHGFPVVSKENQKETIGYAIGKSKLGEILVATFEEGILSVIQGQTEKDMLEELQHLFPKDEPVEKQHDAENALSEVIKFIDNPKYKFKYPVFLHGTEFQKKVWRAVQGVPYGEIATYSDIARKIGAPRAMRAVGSSCTRNKLFFLVPCHRIVRNGYKIPDKASGRRDTLLEKERP